MDQIRESLRNPFHDRFHAERRAGVLDGLHEPEIEVGIKIQVPPLDHVNARISGKTEKGRGFLFRISKPGAVEIIDRDKFPKALGNFYAFQHI